MRLLLTNDDGISAPGLEALLAAARHIGEPCVVAPADAHSGCSHRVTTHEPIRIEPRGTDTYAVHGTPGDCVRLALHRLVPDTSWVLSGINAGGNLGADVHYSGTVAAVREAVLHGWPGIALSQYSKRGIPIDWQRATSWVMPLVRELVGRPWTPGTFWNVNLPHLEAGDPDPKVVFCRLDPGPLPLSYRAEGTGWYYDGNYHERRREDGSDVDVCFRGHIAVTELRLF
jgi:5'-nucleotidase